MRLSGKCERGRWTTCPWLGKYFFSR